MNTDGNGSFLDGVTLLRIGHCQQSGQQHTIKFESVNSAGVQLNNDCGKRVAKGTDWVTERSVPSVPSVAALFYSARRFRLTG